MKWTKYTIDTTTEAVDFLSSMLPDIGVDGIEIEDHLPLSQEDKEKMFVDILPDPEFNDGTAKVSFYMDPELNPEDVVCKASEIVKEVGTFVNVGKGTIQVAMTEDKDWINNWKTFFKPFHATKDIVIKPTWESYEKQEDDKILIEIDPGIAFGTGSHETTKLCIGALEEYVTDKMNVLDVGCGSGILSIAALKMGASHATAIDIDETAVKVAAENMQVNHIADDTITLYAGNLIDDVKLQNETGMELYDIAVANILADVIIPLSGEIAQHIKPGGVFISSGIIDKMEERVAEAIRGNGFKIIKQEAMKDWRLIVAQKN